MVTVRRVRRAERANATAALARAFANDPMMSWIIGHDRISAARLGHLFSHLLGVELRRGDHLVDTVAAYLENSNPRNEALYARYGFERRGTIELPAGAPEVTAMWRDPR